MRVLLLSKYGRLGASSRVRSYQYLPFLAARGISVDVAPLFPDAYVEGFYRGRRPLGGVMKSYLGRVRSLFRARRYDLIWLEYELLPWLPAWIEALLMPRNVPYVVDYDDAVFHRYDRHPVGLVSTVLGDKIDAIMRRAALVVVGNDYLHQHAIAAGAARVEILPTVVDLRRYAVADKSAHRTLTVGWIGSPATAPYLAKLGDALAAAVRQTGSQAVAVGVRADQLAGLPVTARPWSEATEVQEIQNFDVGIMPLADGPFERGKCGYKLIQYMACGIPVVASPVGANVKIVDHGRSGFLAESQLQWVEALCRLCEDARLRKSMGLAGRERVEAEFSLQVAAPRLAEVLESAIRARPFSRIDGS
jgi:glycosyltransferase involved in cell wall biosynthesis